MSKEHGRRNSIDTARHRQWGRQQRPRIQGPETRNSNGSRRKALIEDYSDEDEGENHQASQPPLIKGKALTFHDLDIDMQLEDVSPEHGGSSLQLSLSNDEFLAATNQPAIHRLNTINLDERTPTTTTHKSSMHVSTSDNECEKETKRIGRNGGQL